MTPFKLLTTLLGVFVLLLLLLLKLAQGEAKVFVKKTTWYLLGTLIAFALIGLLGLSLRMPNPASATTIAWVYYTFCLSLGILHGWLMFKALPWASRDLTVREWLFTLAVMAVGSLAFFQTCIYFDKSGRSLDRTFADNFLWGIVLFPVPLLCQLAWELWQRIPSLRVMGWELPFEARPPQPEPGSKSIKLSIRIPLRQGAEESIQVDMLAPIERSLGDTFHYVLYRHNVEKNEFKKIELAEGNSRQKIYQWLFFVKSNRWWGAQKQYLNPNRRIRELGLQNGDMVQVERLKQW